MIINRITIALVAAAILVAGCFRLGIQGDGTIKSEDRAISDFSKIVVTGGYQIKWSGGKPALNISTDENLLPFIKTTVSGDTLKVESARILHPTHDITITLSGVSLSEVRLRGGNRFQAGPLSGSRLKLESTGASEITVDGSVTELEATLTGATKLKAKSLQTQTARLSLVGASDAEVNVTDTLKVFITGAGSLTYSGNPKTVEQKVAGAGSIRPQP